MIADRIVNSKSGDFVLTAGSDSIRELFIERPVIPALNKISTSNREIFPAEVRQYQRVIKT